MPKDRIVVHKQAFDAKEFNSFTEAVQMFDNLRDLLLKEPIAK